jgi:cyclopropane-fatty-acyl-phospholipid synthase
MHLFKLEHRPWAYRVDLALYAGASLALAAFLTVAGPRAYWPEIVLLAILGLAGWTLVEYLLHRFVLHGLRPFSVWHAEHHQHPAALIYTPTILSAMLIAALVFLPARLLGDLWGACALTLGLLTGYLAYSVTHHATHHGRADNAWLKRRKRWHALHHTPMAQPGHYGVTSAFWDHVFGSAPGPRRR